MKSKIHAARAALDRNLFQIQFQVLERPDLFTFDLGRSTPGSTIFEPADGQRINYETFNFSISKDNH